MPISFDSALGIHQQALALRTTRAELLASNLANADTPGYKARDIDFKAAMRNLQMKPMHTNQSVPVNAKHIPVNQSLNNTDILYRVPYQSALDGNTVNENVEKSAFAENALRYQASLTFLSGKFKGLMAAIKGE